MGDDAPINNGICSFEELELNDPNLGWMSPIDLSHLQQGTAYGGIDNLIEVWQSNTTVNNLILVWDRYAATPEDNEHLIQPILEHLIRNRTQMHILTIANVDTNNPTLLQAVLQAMEAAAQSTSLEELWLFGIHSFPASHLQRFFSGNRNLKTLRFVSCAFLDVAAADTDTDTALALGNSHADNALETIYIANQTWSSKQAAKAFIQFMLHPSNQNLVELGVGHIVFENGVVAKEVFRALLGTPTIVKVRLLQSCLSNHFPIILDAAAANNIEKLTVRDINVTEKLEYLTRALPKMKRLSELEMEIGDVAISEDAKSKLIRAVEQHTTLTSVELDDPNDTFTAAEIRMLRRCGIRNTVLPELLSSAEKEEEPAPPQVPRFLTTCHNCPTAALALLVALKNKVGPLQTQEPQQPN